MHNDQGAELPQPTPEQNRRLIKELREVVDFVELSIAMEEQGRVAPSWAERPPSHGPLFMLLGVMMRVLKGQFLYGAELLETTAALHSVEIALHRAAYTELLQATEAAQATNMPPGGAWPVN